MEIKRINEYFDTNGTPHSFSCEGHVDSLLFREQCEKQYFIRPRKIQHEWQKAKWIKRDPDKRHSRGYLTQAPCPWYMKGAKPITIGLIAQSSD